MVAEQTRVGGDGGRTHLEWWRWWWSTLRVGGDGGRTHLELVGGDGGRTD